jgi:hypothetical protein
LQEILEILEKMKLVMSLFTFTLVLLVANVAAQGNMFKVPVAPCNGECRNLIRGFHFSGPENVESLADRLESDSEIPEKKNRSRNAPPNHFLFLSLLPASSFDLLTSVFFDSGEFVLGELV